MSTQGKTRRERLQTLDVSDRASAPNYVEHEGIGPDADGGGDELIQRPRDERGYDGLARRGVQGGLMYYFFGCAQATSMTSCFVTG